MTREELKLNDFKGFKKYLFSDSELFWSKLYDKVYGIFTPPILKPETLPEYQLDHYAMWMVISVYKLRNKPQFCNEAYRPIVCCYACDWTNVVIAKHKQCIKACPLILDTYYGCGSEYSNWCEDHNRRKNAYNIAYLKWRDVS